MQRLPGFRDFYPEPLPASDVWSADARQYIFDRWRATARRYGFREYDGPPLEPLELFTVKSGEEIVGQLYNFTDKGDRAVALRPEMTPTLARMAAAAERRAEPDGSEGVVQCAPRAYVHVHVAGGHQRQAGFQCMVFQPLEACAVVWTEQQLGGDPAAPGEA